MRLGPWSNTVSVLIRRDTRERLLVTTPLPLPLCILRGKTVRTKWPIARREQSPWQSPNLHRILILHFPASRHKEEMLSFKSRPVVFCHSSPSRLRHWLNRNVRAESRQLCITQLSQRLLHKLNFEKCWSSPGQNPKALSATQAAFPGVPWRTEMNIPRPRNSQ
jgi:hypothetical protein